MEKYGITGECMGDDSFDKNKDAALTKAQKELDAVKCPTTGAGKATCEAFKTDGAKSVKKIVEAYELKYKVTADAARKKSQLEFTSAKIAL